MNDRTKAWITCLAMVVLLAAVSALAVAFRPLGKTVAHLRAAPDGRDVVELRGIYAEEEAVEKAAGYMRVLGHDGKVLRLGGNGVIEMDRKVVNCDCEVCEFLRIWWMARAEEKAKEEPCSTAVSK